MVISASAFNTPANGVMAFYSGSKGVAAGWYKIEKAKPAWTDTSIGGIVLPGAWLNGFYTAETDRELFIPAAEMGPVTHE
jgi:hypothetical protein